MHITFAHLMGILIHESEFFSPYILESYGPATSPFGDGYGYGYATINKGDGEGGFDDVDLNQEDYIGPDWSL